MMLTADEMEQWRQDELAALREERDEALRNLRIQTERVVGDAERKRYEQMRAALERSLPHVPDFVADEVRAALAATGEERKAHAPTSEQVQAWIERAYRQPDDPTRLDAPRFTRWNMETAFQAGFALAATGEENERLREQVASGRQTPVEDIG